MRVGEAIGISKVAEVVAEIVDVVASWPAYAARAGVPDDRTAAIATTHRLDLRPRPT